MTTVAVAARPMSSEGIKAALSSVIAADRILVRPIDLIAFASDASFYRLIPKAVVQAASEQEVRELFAFSQRIGVPMTFRAAGSSLSGQSISDGLLVEVARHWRGVQVEENGKRIRCQPGVIGARANQLLAPYGAKIGPDPASIATCTIGGILSNNSSGMCCGVEQNAYHTLRSMRFMLPSGMVIDTAQPDADEHFHAREPELARGVLELKAQLDSNAALRERARSKYRMKNTTGYSLNALLDFDKAADIFQHLLIGSEGTLAFIAEAVLNTVPDLPVKYTGLLLFPDLYAAAASIVPLRGAGAKALEIMDRASLRSVENQAGVPACCRSFSQLTKLSARNWSALPPMPLADCACMRCHCSRTMLPSRRCFGRFAPACSHPWDRYGNRALRSSSKTWRFPSRRWLTPRPISQSCSINTTTTTPSSLVTRKTATCTLLSRRASTTRQPLTSMRVLSTTWLLWW